jgi:hypothetical protein
MKSNPESNSRVDSVKEQTKQALSEAYQLTCARRFGRTRGFYLTGDLVALHLTTSTVEGEQYEVCLTCTGRGYPQPLWKDVLVVAAARGPSRIDLHLGRIDERGGLRLGNLTAVEYKLYINPLSIFAERPLDATGRLALDQFSANREMRGSVLRESNQTRYVVEFRNAPPANSKLVCCTFSPSSLSAKVLGLVEPTHDPERESWVGMVEETHATAFAADERVAFLALPDL